MKKIFVGVFALICFSSYTQLSSDYRLAPTDSGQDTDEVITITNTKTSEQKTATLCPGTGYTCEIRYTDGDGDPAVYASKKGRGKSDIEF